MRNLASALLACLSCVTLLVAGCSSGSSAHQLSVTVDAACGLAVYQLDVTAQGGSVSAHFAYPSTPGGDPLTLPQTVTVPLSSAQGPVTVSIDGLDRSGKVLASGSASGSAGASLQITLAGPGCQDGSATPADMSVPPIAAPYVFFYGKSGDAPARVGAYSVRTDGSGLKALGCIDSIDGGTQLFDKGNGTDDHLTAQWLARADYASSSVGRFVWDDESQDAPSYHLLLGDPLTDCQTRTPVRLDDDGSVVHAFPRFSLEGLRVAYLEGQSGPGYSMLKVANTDGTGHLLVFTASGSQVIASAAPSWIPTLSGPSLAWLIVTFPPMPGPPDYQLWNLDLSTCTAGACPAPTAPACDFGTSFQIDQVETLSATQVLMSANGGTSSNLLIVNLPTACPGGTYSGTTGVTNLTNNPAGVNSRDFQLSPDGKTVLFVSDADPPDGGTLSDDLWTVPTDGSSPPKHFAGSRDANDVAPQYGPASTVVWTQLRDTDGGAYAGSVMVAPLADPASAHAVSGPTLDSAATGSNSGSGCSMGGGHAGGGLALLGLLLLTLGLRRPSNKEVGK